jgi:CheY-like chemotaxis protein
MSETIRVLLIEDNPGDADLTKETLEENRLHVEIAIAVDGPQARVRRHRRAACDREPLPDLILLDLNLPKMSGRDVLADIKQDPALRNIPVVVLTSSDAEQDIVKSYELGANCYVTKPVGLEAFQSIVRTLDGFWLTVVKLP